MHPSCFAIVELPTAISLSNSALGIQFPARIAGHDFQLETPSLNKARKNTPAPYRFGEFLENLGPTKSAHRYLKDAQKIDWGRVIQSDKQGSSIAQVNHLFATFADRNQTSSDCSDAIYLANDEWLDRFDALLRLISNQRTFGVTRLSGYVNTHFRLFKTRPIKIISPPQQTITVSLLHARPFDSADHDQLIRAVNLCSQGKVIPLQFSLLLKAYDAHQANDPRSIVIEASTAVEVAATRRIGSILENDQVPKNYINLILKAHEGLAKRMSLLQRLGIKIPISKKCLDDEIVKIRNMTIHGGYSVTSREAEKLLFHSQQIIWDITPDFAVPPIT